MATIEQLRRESEPNKVQGIEIETLSNAPLIGVMLIDTDSGMVRLSINRAVAETLQEELDTFLGD